MRFVSLAISALAGVTAVGAGSFAVSGCSANGGPADVAAFDAAPESGDSAADAGADAGDEGADAAAVTMQMPVIPTCAAPTEAALRDESGVYRCVALGASVDASGSVEWPSTTDAAGPFVFVRAGAPAGGDGGSMGSALATVAAGVERLATLPSGGTLVLARGSYAVSQPVALRGPSHVLGAGAGRTVLVVARGSGGVVAEGGAQASVRGVTVRYEAASSGDDTTHVAVRARAGAELSLRDVFVENAHTGVYSQNATVTAEALTVRSTASFGVLGVQGGRVSLSHFVVRDGAAGVSIQDSSRVHLSEGLVAGHTADGVFISGAGDTHAGAMQCSLSGASMMAGPLDCVSRVTIQDSSRTGFSALGGRRIEARGLTILRTRAMADGSGGDGLYVADGARMAVDPEMLGGAARRGSGSVIAGNARTGVLVAGDATEAGAGSLRARGLAVGANEGPGVYVQEGGRVEEFAVALVLANTAVGFATVDRGVLVGIQDSSIADTRAGRIVGAERTIADLGDGLVLDGAAGVTVANNTFANNPRYALLAKAASGAAMNNSGSNNRFGALAWNSPSLVLDAATMAIGAREASPRDEPTAPARVTHR